MTKKFLLKLSVIVVLGGIVICSLYGLYNIAIQKNLELKEAICVQAQQLTNQLNEAINASYMEEYRLVEGEIKKVSRHIFAERDIQLCYSEKNTISYSTKTASIRIHGVVQEDFWQKCIKIIPEDSSIVIKYGEDDIQLIAEIINQEEYESTLFNSKEYLEGIVQDSSRLLQMAVSGKYIPPTYEKSYWVENLDLLKRYEWIFISEEFQDTLKAKFPEYAVEFKASSPLLTESEKQTLKTWIWG